MNIKDAYKENDKINVVFASDNNYAQHAAIAMVSILVNMIDPQKVNFYLLADGICDTVREKIMQTILPFGASLFFIDVEVDNDSDFFVSGQLSRTAYFRLKMENLLPKSICKVIYLDCDLLVQEDIKQLWEIDLQGKPIAAVPDYGIMASSKTWKGKQKILGIQPEDNYFNSGVLVVDLQQWREYNYGYQAEHLARVHKYQHHDQDALNQLFYRKWHVLPLRWNVIPPVWNLFLKVLIRRRFRDSALKARLNIAILHYAGGYKPWEYPLYEEFNAQYYKCLQKSAFYDVPMPQPDPRRRHRSIKRQLQRIRWGNFWQKLLLS